MRTSCRFSISIPRPRLGRWARRSARLTSRFCGRSASPSRSMSASNSREVALHMEHSLTYKQRLLTETPDPHLPEIDETVHSRLEHMMPRLAKVAAATEQLKASNPMRWVGLMNPCKAQAEEILMAELIHS